MKHVELDPKWLGKNIFTPGKCLSTRPAKLKKQRQPDWFTSKPKKLSFDAHLKSENGFPSHFYSNSINSIKKISKIKKKNFHIFHPPAHPPNPRHISALGLKIKNRKRQPESMIVTCTHAKFQAIWWSHRFWGFFWFEKSSPRVLIQGCL